MYTILLYSTSTKLNLFLQEIYFCIVYVNQESIDCLYMFNFNM